MKAYTGIGLTACDVEELVRRERSDAREHRNARQGSSLCAHTQETPTRPRMTQWPAARPTSVPNVVPIPDLELECAQLRIWEIGPDDLFVVLAMLLERRELEKLFAEIECDDHSGIREEVLLRDALARCTKPCRFAMRIERLLDGRTGDLRRRLARCPMIELAEWWSREGNREGGPALGAFCWSLASDPRCVVGELRRRVLGEVAVRALRQFARPKPSSKLGDAGQGEETTG